MLVSLAAFAAAGCTPAVLTPPATPRGRLRPDREGLAVEGTGLRIDFGRHVDGVIAAVSRVLGRRPDADALLAECGAGPVRAVTWGAGLTLHFANNDFRGWVARSPRFLPVNGIGPGVTRGELEARGIALTRTTLGAEFEADGIRGVIEGAGPNAPVDLAWAGLSCFFR